jgi:hypothetical protein
MTPTTDRPTRTSPSPGIRVDRANRAGIAASRVARVSEAARDRAEVAVRTADRTVRVARDSRTGIAVSKADRDSKVGTPAVSRAEPVASKVRQTAPANRTCR